MKINKNFKGITLVALVVTIVVLIILATISINIIFGDEGIVEKAKEAIVKWVNAEKEEKQILADVSNSIDGYIIGEREQITIDKEEYENLKNTVNTLQKKPILLERTWSLSSVAVPAASWQTVETISLSGYGTGKAIITCTASNTTNAQVKRFEMQVKSNNGLYLTDGSYSTNTTSVWLRVSPSATINYDENTSIMIELYSDVAHTPNYGYSITLFPD